MHYERAPRFSKVEAGRGGAASAALRCVGASLRCGGTRGWSGVVGPAKNRSRFGTDLIHARHSFPSRSRASQQSSIRGNILVGAQALFRLSGSRNHPKGGPGSIQCNWHLNFLSHFWGALQSCTPPPTCGLVEPQVFPRSPGSRA